MTVTEQLSKKKLFGGRFLIYILTLKQEKEAFMYCTKCQKDVAALNGVCPQCGQDLTILKNRKPINQTATIPKNKAIYCPHCQKYVIESNGACSQCHENLTTSTPESQTTQNNNKHTGITVLLFIILSVTVFFILQYLYKH
ncbi:hypothetical protein SAMN02745728_01933 [Desulfovibrio litoralis DSM 11393]|uniref:Double zinc ribbon n=2 Tax=Desulfovibrio litoralis TaxID=466107 RepID=A0A1M7TEX1_9BACT|nr:hypothetical protein SAMN02745728_01933 [Desulfovibrio litoralis DSM 11393]